MTQRVPHEDVQPLPPARRLLLAIGFGAYKAVLSPILHLVAPSRCIYLPTCSEYAYTAMSRFGIARGSWLALRRLARCHPWGAGGLDPVPDRSSLPTYLHPPASVRTQNGVDHLS